MRGERVCRGAVEESVRARPSVATRVRACGSWCVAASSREVRQRGRAGAAPTNRNSKSSSSNAYCKCKEDKCGQIPFKLSDTDAPHLGCQSFSVTGSYRTGTYYV